MAKSKYQRKEPSPNPKLPKALALALGDKKSSVDAGTLLSDLIEVWGGTRQLATDIHAEYRRAGAGGMSRQRILEMFQRLIMYASDRDVTKVVKPAELSQEELDDLALSYAKRVMGHGTAKNPAEPVVPAAAPGYQDEEEGWA